MCSSAHAGMAISAPAGLLELQAITASPSRRSAAGELGRRTTLPVGRHHTCSSCLEHPHTRIAGTSQFMLSITSERVKSPIERRDRRRSPDPRSLPSPLWAGVSTRSKTPQRWSPRRRATATEVPDPHRDLRCTSVADRWASSSRDPPRSPGPMAADPGPRGGGPPYDPRLRRLPGHAWRDPHLAGTTVVDLLREQRSRPRGGDQQRARGRVSPAELARRASGHHLVLTKPGANIFEQGGDSQLAGGPGLGSRRRCCSPTSHHDAAGARDDGSPPTPLRPTEPPESAVRMVEGRAGVWASRGPPASRLEASCLRSTSLSHGQHARDGRSGRCRQVDRSRRDPAAVLHVQ